MTGPTMWRALLCGAVGAGPLLTSACEPQPPEATGGVFVEESFGASGESCGRGVAVLMTDESYASVNVALVGLDGSTLSGSFISSASADPSLNAALSGDAVFPTEKMSGEIVLIDRFPNSVITFVDVETANVKRQTAVRTGFNANPQDYIELSAGGALVSRLEKNPTPGNEEFDEGDDLLVLGGAASGILGRIDLAEYQGEQGGRARPSTMARAGESIFVALTRHDRTFEEADEGAILVVRGDSGEPVSLHRVRGMKNCSGLARSPQGTHLAVSCSGLLTDANGPRSPSSGVVVYRLRDADKPARVQLSEEFRVSAEELAFGPFGPSLSYATDSLLLVNTFGALEGDDAGRPDRIVSLDVDGGGHEVLVESRERPFNLGSVRCVAPCGVCFVADAERGVLHRFAVAGQGFAEPTRHVVQNDVGLPPRFLGLF